MKRTRRLHAGLGAGEGAQAHAEVVPDQHDGPPGSWRWAARSRSRYSVQVNAFVSPLHPRQRLSRLRWPGRQQASPATETCPVPPRSFYLGQVSFFHTPAAPSSRSMARRAPIWQAQPAAAQQVPDPRDGVLHPEPPGDQVPDAGQRPPLVLPGRRPAARHPAPRPARPAAPFQPAPRRLPAGPHPSRPARPAREIRPAGRGARVRPVAGACEALAGFSWMSRTGSGR